MLAVISGIILIFYLVIKQANRKKRKEQDRWSAFRPQEFHSYQQSLLQQQTTTQPAKISTFCSNCGVSMRIKPIICTNCGQKSLKSTDDLDIQPGSYCM